MNRVDRLHAILVHLQSKKIVTAREIADRFEISQRPVYRDLRALEAGGVPIGAEAGVGYFLMEGYHLPPVMFTREEANALLTGEKLIRKHGNKPLRKGYQDALYKIKAVLDRDNKEAMETLDKQILVDPYGLEFRDQSDTAHLSELQKVLPAHKQVKIKYLAGYTVEATERIIEPIGLVFYGTRWHLIAYCLLREDYRDFRLDRIEHLEILKQDLNINHHPSISAYIQKIISETELIDVQIKVKKSIAKYIETPKYQFGWVSEQEDGDWLRMQFAVFDLDLMARWMLMFGENVEIIEPTELQISILKLVDQLNNYWNKR